MQAAALARTLTPWRTADRRLSEALARAISTAILDGRVAIASRLPSERALAAALQTSRVTVSAAYAELRADRWIETARGAGSRARLPESLDARIDVAPSGRWETIDLAQAAPSAPLPAYRRALEEASARLGRHTPDAAADILSELRDAVADRYTARGLRTRSDQILITTGAGAALALYATQVLAPGARILVESPTYPGALDLLRSARLRPLGWPIGAGRDLELFEAVVRESRPSAAYLILDFHNPTGNLATENERRAIAAVARGAGVPLILDETMRELDLRPGHPPAPPTDETNALLLGSLAKTVWGGLRVGWLRASRHTVARLEAVPERYYMTPPILEQLMATGLLRELDELAAARRAQLVRQLAALRTHLDDLPELRLTEVPAGGLTAWTELAPGASSAELTRRGPEHGLRLMPGGRCSPESVLDGFLRLPFTLAPDALDEAGRRMRELLTSAI